MGKNIGIWVEGDENKEGGKMGIKIGAKHDIRHDAPLFGQTLLN